MNERIYIHNIFAMLSHTGSVISSFFANYRSHDTYTLVKFK